MESTPAPPGRGMKTLLRASFAVIACVLASYGIGRACHQDETFILWFTDGTWAQIFERFRSEPFPPFYHILIKAWLDLFGRTEVTLRAFSGACFFASFAAIWWLGRPLFRRAELGTILVASLVARAVASSAIIGRMYELMYLESCVATLAFVGLFSGRGSRRWAAIALFAANLAGLMTHYFFTFVLLAEGVAFLLSCRRRSWASFFACVVLPVVLFAGTWGPMLRAQLTSGRFAPGSTLEPAPVSLSMLKSILLGYFDPLRTALVAGLMVALLAFDRRGGRWRVRGWSGLASRGRRLWSDPRFRVFGLFWAVVVVVPLAIAMGKGGDLFKPLPISMLTVLPALVLLTLAAGRCDRRLRATVGVVALAGVLAGDVLNRDKAMKRGTDNRSAISTMLKEASADDVVVYYVNQCTLFPYYVKQLGGDRKPVLMVFPEDQYEHAGWYHAKLQLGDPGRRSRALHAFGRRVADHLQAHPGARAWVVQDLWEAQLTEGVSRELDAVLRRVGRVPASADNFDAYLVYEAKPGPVAAAR